MQTTEIVRVGSELSDDEIVATYGPLIERAIAAFSVDPLYLIEMSEKASLIAYKRSLWEVRMEAQRAEAEARRSCQLDGGACPFTCTNVGACGFGTCRYASDDHKRFESEPTNEGRERPMDTAHPTYRLEDTIALMLADRSISPPQRRTRGRSKTSAA